MLRPQGSRATAAGSLAWRAEPESPPPAAPPCTAPSHSLSGALAWAIRSSLSPADQVLHSHS